ncbi:hypothetical protein [Fibrobacter sp.]|uniref:hypothetical protein n=1 Tax=Fibrobacter sp. TaxID=35828 RepID=UPI0038704B9E
MKSLTSVRTARLVASLIAILGMFFFAAERVLVKVCVMAKDGVQMGLNRYSNSFTGRFAAENFSDDKKLLDVLRQANELFPIAEKVSLALFIICLILFIVAAFGIAFPKQFCHVLVAVKLLKWQDGIVLQDMKLSGTPSEGPSVSDKLKELCGKIAAVAKKVQPKYWIFIGCSLVFVLVLVFGVRGCSAPSVFGGSQAVTDDLNGQTLYYIQAQKSFFAKTNKVGGPKSLQMPDSLVSDYFTYRITGGKFTATLNKNVKDCPAGTRWSVSAATKGIFTLDLVLYRAAPKDTNCVFISPNFKNLGRK